MSAKKRVTKKRAAPKALPSTWNLEQLDEELRVAFGFAARPGVARVGDSVPYVIPQKRPVPQTRAEKKRGATVVMEDVPWTDAQLAAIQTTLEAHVANPLWGEKQDARAIRLILTDADFDAALTAAAGTLTAPQRDVLLQKLIRSVRALGRIARNEAQ